LTALGEKYPDSSPPAFFRGTVEPESPQSGRSFSAKYPVHHHLKLITAFAAKLKNKSVAAL
jgi:hypothetical protein